MKSLGETTLALTYSNNQMSHLSSYYLSTDPPFISILSIHCPLFLFSLSFCLWLRWISRNFPRGWILFFYSFIGIPLLNSLHFLAVWLKLSNSPIVQAHLYAYVHPSDTYAFAHMFGIFSWMFSIAFVSPTTIAFGYSESFYSSMSCKTDWVHIRRYELFPHPITT